MVLSNENNYHFIACAMSVNREPAPSCHARREQETWLDKNRRAKYIHGILLGFPFIS
jgi:hypothetical protein